MARRACKLSVQQVLAVDAWAKLPSLLEDFAASVTDGASKDSAGWNDE
jgi:hypothetical protein